MLFSPLLVGSRSPRGFLLGLAFLLVGLAGCQSKEPPSSYVARVGSHYLTQEDLSHLLDDMGPIPDTMEARQQIIDQWTNRMLLYREARRLNLQSVEAVQRKLERQRRSILIAALTNRIYEKAGPSPSMEEVRTYFQHHKDRLRLREPYVKVHYLPTESRAGAQTVRQTLLRSSPLSDSLWRRLVRTHAAPSSRARRMSRRFWSKSRLSRQLPFPATEIARLDRGEVAPIVEKNNQYHVLQLIRRLPKGTEPKLKWVEDKIRRRLRIRARKQMYTREVQRLRSKARANGALEVP